eukprot:1307074-Lingulodinium_polyedra.AAC.1
MPGRSGPRQARASSTARPLGAPSTVRCAQSWPSCRTSTSLATRGSARIGPGCLALANTPARWNRCSRTRTRWPPRRGCWR